MRMEWRVKANPPYKVPTYGLVRRARSKADCRLSQYCGDCPSALPANNANSAVIGRDPPMTYDTRIAAPPMARANSA
jgi:hypothetical protein